MIWPCPGLPSLVSLLTLFVWASAGSFQAWMLNIHPSIVDVILAQPLTRGCSPPQAQHPPLNPGRRPQPRMLAQHPPLRHGAETKEERGREQRAESREQREERREKREERREKREERREKREERREKREERREKREERREKRQERRGKREESREQREERRENRGESERDGRTRGKRLK